MHYLWFIIPPDYYYTYMNYIMTCWGRQKTERPIHNYLQ